MASSPRPEPRATHFIEWHGKAVPRGKGFLRGKRLRCPDGHEITRPGILLGDDLVFCHHKPSPGQASCGWSIYVLAMPARGGRHRIFAADCTRDELAEIQHLELDADGILAYFGQEFVR